jgi:hypothetical protein
VKIKITTYHGTETITLDLGDTVRIHPDTRGTFLPVLRDETCIVTNLVNRGTKRQPEWWAHIQAVDERRTGGNGTPMFRADRWVDVANLELVSRTSLECSSRGVA